MPNLSNVVNQLQSQRKEVQSQLARLDAALNALRGFNSTNGSGASHSSSYSGRSISAAGRRAISLAQKARWAKRAAEGQAGAAKPKRTLSAAARKKIAQAQKARWAAWKKQKATA
jgi:hypothetical protein